MKKKSLFIILFAFIVLLSGCGNQKGSSKKETVAVEVQGQVYFFTDEGNFHQMYFPYQKDSTLMRVKNNGDSHKGILYYLEDSQDVLFRVNLCYFHDQTVDYFLGMHGVAFEDVSSKTIQGTEWSYYSEEKANYQTDYYIGQYGVDMYSVEFVIEKNSEIDLEEFENAFLSQITFR